MRTSAEAAMDASTCTKCRLSQGRTQVVYGVGDPSADLMFIGEAPGFHEDKQGEPFVGAAGQLLNQLLSEVEIPRSDVYINNVILGMDPVELRARNAAATGTVLPTGQVIGGAAPVREVIERCGAIPMPSPAPPGRRNAVELPGGVAGNLGRGEGVRRTSSGTTRVCTIPEPCRRPSTGRSR